MPRCRRKGARSELPRLVGCHPLGARSRALHGAVPPFYLAYGVEFIKVVASTRQFSDIEQAFTDLGQATRSLLTRGLEVTGTGPEERAQAMVSYTILAKGQ